MTIVERLTRFVEKVFKTNLDTFLRALQLSPNAQGYVNGSVTELLLKQELETRYGFEVRRIREKWEGKKLPRHHGDLYFRIPSKERWYVLECKGVKSNSEKWHKLYNLANLKRFLVTHADKISWVNTQGDIDQQIDEWLSTHLPKFHDEFSLPLYEYEEVQNYNPKRETDKSRAMARLQGLSRAQINGMFEERLAYVMSRIKVLETHFVSGVSASNDRTQATPRKDEFAVVAIDIALRYHSHRFVYANPQHLDASGDDPNHLQQNYIMGFVFTDADGTSHLEITEDWYEDLHDVVDTLGHTESVEEADMQIDERFSGGYEDA